MSKWYYTLDVSKYTRVFISVHQEDERVPGITLRRPYLDIGIAVLKKNHDGELSLVALKDLIVDRQTELEVDLDPGSYIVVPRTTGCMLREPIGSAPENIRLIDYSGELSDLAELSIADIFRKFDMLLNRELTFPEFKNFYEQIGRQLTETDFRAKFLQKF
jgi:hypothetical protein